MITSAFEIQNENSTEKPAFSSFYKSETKQATGQESKLQSRTKEAH